jgi:hypothetical protein
VSTYGACQLIFPGPLTRSSCLGHCEVLLASAVWRALEELVRPTAKLLCEDKTIGGGGFAAHRPESGCMWGRRGEWLSALNLQTLVQQYVARRPRLKYMRRSKCMKRTLGSQQSREYIYGGNSKRTHARRFGVHRMVHQSAAPRGPPHQTATLGVALYCTRLQLTV